MRRTDWAALVLAVLGALLSIWVSFEVYEGLPHLEDEFAFLWEAEVMAEDRISIPSPFEKRSFLVPFVVDHEGQRFGKYPPGWPAALSLGARVGAPWAVNALLAGVSIWLIYRLGSKVSGQVVGLVAALLALLSPMFLMLSGSLLSHAYSLFLASAFMLAWLELFPRKGRSEGSDEVPTWIPVSIAGLTLGSLALTRPLTAVGVALPFVIHGLILMVRGGGEVRWRLVAIGLVAVILSAFLFIWQAALAGDPFKNLYSLWWEYDRLGFGPGIGVTESGHSLWLAYWNARWSLGAGVHDLFGWPYLSWILIPFGLAALSIGRNRDGWLLFMVFPSLVLVYAAYWVGAWLYGPRYYYESLPGLTIASAVGIAWLGGWLTSGARCARFRRYVVGALVILLIALNVGFYLPPRLDMMNRLNNISRSNHRPFEVADFERTLVFVHPHEIWTEYGTLLTLTPPFSDDDLVLVYSRGPVADARLAAMYSGWEILHYYPDEPYVYYRNPKPSVIVEVQASP